MKKLPILLLFFSTKVLCQTIGTFNSVIPTGQTEQFVIPSTHKFQKLIKTGEALSAGGVMKSNPDFTCFVPIGGSSTNGYVTVNHEIAPGGVSVLDVNYSNTTKLWSISNSQAADLSAINGLTAANCSGALTPWGTVLSGEEVVYTADSNNDGYNDVGWLIETNPVTRQVIRKLWALGCMPHENAAFSSDGTKIYFGSENSSNGFLYKFVCTTANDPTSGTLYVLKLTGGGNGTWVVIPNTTQNERNNTLSLSAAVGATNFNRIEDVEVGPDGKVYVTSTNNQEIYRLVDNGTTVSNYETYVSNQCYNIGGICEPYGYVGQSGNDNLAFDGEGNLWILQDGGRNHIWVVGPNHVAGGTNDVRLFATTPLGSEPTGITFSPDYKFLFISIQHPSGGNTTAQTDAAGNAVVFNAGTTLVIARSEFLGSTPSLSVSPKIFLEGPYTGNGMMSDNLRSGNILPTNQPFNNLTFAGTPALPYSGTETTTTTVLSVTGNNAIVDWVLLELRDGADRTNVITRRAALLQRDGDVVDVDGTSAVQFANTPTGNYYISIKHRNHLKFITQNAVSLGAGINSLNFTNNTIPLYGTNPLRLIETILGVPIYAMYSGDLDRSGFIDATDRSAAWDFRNVTGYNVNDCDLDGSVGASDRSNTWNNRNVSTSF